ncbi:potassium voltage-gated channel subfamily S member 1-like [Corythoichthys intestinalis]|uniref:potassium voltage-gated channel subfamily S member 1-like n=1 Tax=Corythoichthys intestinalis TaxID=161448 RepID=UPI0025A5D8D6|nr:potassium voltage-gated channel subfamily S member 1-like [Corythoichthys intestinalis]XP_057701980.1 potassium voltage-gated channel subfamily S member 1-like [Corythoichthys intestinalis]XP_057701981.1 potassium voltage-gated channel subfamily S member 1-like [Corythoichthys intestinalis]
MVTERRGRATLRLDAGEGLVHVNVGGLRRSLCCGTLTKFPETRLGKLLDCHSEEDILQVCDDYDVQRKEFYFDRNPILFRYVLHFYRTGKLHIMDELCVFSFSQEMEYWGIGDFFLASCCSFRYHERKLGSRLRPSWDDDIDEDRLGGGAIRAERNDIQRLRTELQHFARLRCGAARRCLWLTLENPGYSLPGKLFSVVAVGVLLASLTATCIKSVPEYKTLDSDGNLVEDPTVGAVEVLSTCWFTLEVVLRFLLAPNRKQFFHRPLNVIDATCVLPVYVTLLCDWTLGAQSEQGMMGRVLQVFRLLRVFRVLKLARHSTGLRSLGATLRHSYREVGILLLYLAVGVSVFSGMAYTAEYQEEEGLDTIPACWWWGTVSMTTVGYGDVVPVTVGGKLAAGGCILGGTLVVALPITLIFNKFSHFYRCQKALEASVRNRARGDEEGGDGGVVNRSYVEDRAAETRPL